jgi:hypothetical protein
MGESAFGYNMFLPPILMFSGDCAIVSLLSAILSLFTKSSQ